MSTRPPRRSPGSTGAKAETPRLSRTTAELVRRAVDSYLANLDPEGDDLLPLLLGPCDPHREGA